ncbi:TniQ family protein [Rheinheimera fenheensis]|uniref:TniQ family protein n=1 Tax=Rheinheimera fenheensis TaxID=3152295 RepID=UPI003F7EF3AE
MASSYSWHPGSSVVALNKELQIQLLPDESLSSFLVRLSHQFGMTPLALTECIAPCSRAWSIDTDRLKSRFLKSLVQWSGISEDVLSQATVRCYENIASVEQQKQDQVRAWFTSLGIRNRKRETGFSYCPLCFAEDKYPYLRVQWRFAWHTECVKHTCGLLDRCQRCGESIKPHLLPVKTPRISICYHCEFDARYAKTRPIRDITARTQSYIDTILFTGGAAILGNQLNCSDVFEYLYFWISLLRRARRTQTGALYRLLSLFPCELSEVDEYSKGWRFEKLPVEERSSLMQGLDFVLAMDRQQLQLHLLNMGLSKQSFIGDWDAPPSVLSPIVDALPDNSKSRAKSKTTKDLRPAPKYLVVRRMKRLLSSFRDRQNVSQSKN